MGGVRVTAVLFAGPPGHVNGSCFAAHPLETDFFLCSEEIRAVLQRYDPDFRCVSWKGLVADWVRRGWRRSDINRILFCSSLLAALWDWMKHMLILQNM